MALAAWIARQLRMTPSRVRPKLDDESTFLTADLTCFIYPFFVRPAHRAANTLNERPLP